MDKKNKGDERIDIEEDDNTVQETENEDEEEKPVELNIDNVDDQIDWLEWYTIDSISSKGFYLVSQEPVKIYDSNGAEIDVDEDDDEYKEHQVIRRIGVRELFDFSQKPPVFRAEFYDKNIVYCAGYGDIYYGNIDIKEYKTENGAEEYVIVPDGKGRIYNNKKCVYAGYFNNGKKTTGLTKEGEEQYFFDYKGNKPFVSHESEDLLISFETNDDLAKNRRLSDIERYNNSIFFDSKTGNIIDKNGYKKDAKVKNIKIQIDNGYRYDLSNKNSNFLDENGNKIPYNFKHKQDMVINVEDIVKQIVKIVEKSKDTLKVIEIVGISSYGIFEDEKGKKLINSITEKLRRTIKNNKIKIFFSNTEDPVTYHKEQYKCGKELYTIVDRNRKYYCFNDSTYDFDECESKEEYDGELKKNGYYENNSISSDEEKIGNIILLESKNKIFEDEVDKIVEAREKDSKDVVDELEAKNKSIAESKVSALNADQQLEDSKLSISEIIITIIAGMIFPIVGGVMVADFFKSKHRETDLIERIKREEERIKKEEKKSGQKGDNGVDKKQENNKQQQQKDGKNDESQEKQNIQGENKEQKPEEDSYSQKRMDISQKTNINLSKESKQIS